MARKPDPPIVDPHPRPADDIRVGIGGWAFAPWRGIFYPPGLPQRRELEFASRHMDAIEINGTYYRAQTPPTYARWRDAAPPGFVFSAKAPMRITQSRDLAATAAQVDAFVGDIATLGPALGPIVWQFDAGQRIERDSFARFVEALPRQVDGLRIRHALDVRDRSFVDADYVALARAHDCAIVLADSPQHPLVADVTTDFVYVRAMRAREALAAGYTDAELDRWRDRARQWASGTVPDNLPLLAPVPPRRAREVFVFFIGADKLRNPAAALALRRRLAGA